MTRCAAPGGAAALLMLCHALIPVRSAAGGIEFPAGGTRGLGRGGANMARADDGHVMVRNPALLADLWGDQALISSHLLLVNACMQPTGFYGYAVDGSDVADFGDGPVVLSAPPGTDLAGQPLTDFATEPYHEVCFQGPEPFLPTIALTTKLSDDLGVGLGFMPPDAAVLAQWGNPDGTIDTAGGRRPNPLRFLRSSQYATVVPLAAAVGYRWTDWLALGASVSWTLIAYNARTWSAEPANLNPSSNIRVDLFGRDLFVPGFVASAHLSPFDFLDISVGFRWSDRIQSKAKLDITTGAFGAGELRYRTLEGQETSLPGRLPSITHNVSGVVDAPPLSVPQLSFGIRVADRLAPRPPRLSPVAQSRRDTIVDDAMQLERWDVELDAVYYFNRAYDRSYFLNSDDLDVLLRTQRDGQISRGQGVVGRCLERAADGIACASERITETPFGGQDQLSLRLGADYNPLPGRLSLRAGASYETDGAPVSMTHPLFYMLGRIGLHAGLTIRFAGRTDLSLAVAYFLQRSVRLGINDSRYPRNRTGPEYHFPQPGEVIDGVAGLPVPSSGDAPPGYINAGSYHFDLTVLSASLAQHF